MSCIRTSRLTAVIIAIIALPATAQAGFFDQLFGGQPQPFFGFQRYGAPAGAPLRYRAHHAKAAADEKPVRQTPTDLMHDGTLRYGDAVMMESGITVFTGERGSSHDREDFSPLQNAKHIKPSEKLALDALDGPKLSDRLVSGRSSAVTIPIAKGVLISDGSGKSIRYVGP